MSFSIVNDLLQKDGKAVDFVKSPHVGGALKPRFVIIHYTASGPNSDIAKYFQSPGAKVSAHLVVRRDGTVKQCVAFDKVGWHAGKSSHIDNAGKTIIGLNQHSIGIEIENWGPLKKTGGSWVSWTGVAVDSSKVIEARHKFGVPDCGWEIFTESQIETVIDLTQAIVGKYPIEEILGHDDISPGRKSDPGPAWPMDSFKARVYGRDDDTADVWVVNSPTGLNLRDGPSASSALIRKEPLPTGTKVIMLEAAGNWRHVAVLNTQGDPDITGWVHGAYLRDI